MQQGVALKWADALRSTDASYDASQFGFEAGGKTYRCPFGVLFDAVAPDGWSIGWDGVSHVWNGAQFSVPASFAARNKMKTDGSAAQSAFERMRSFREAADYVLANYQVI